MIKGSKGHGEKSSSSSSLKKSNKGPNFYVDLQKDDVEIMKVNFRLLFNIKMFFNFRKF